ncbi:amino acid/amide ABC transporter membrane protein 1, HAAT family [Acetomicrobium mobile DSM 13181]|uniref:Amino acid/amide ABC transporter membrane protein 1, HAAT family n=1 Tax=Acetomicrobium mobile (strain ATCC BAA-54 / DSM 13181 / JCM 12221 / NGA) TaxID=891968 RepID=I4BU02_ACEMN|nr:branched-chain amino acid ABC transporter permease [Acetomicrobium mobile]AFM20759.1 amino acid/amide ABC transporter membrane protein 1, HAAT family [Acetomicrobium mobile DSM 13181]
MLQLLVDAFVLGCSYALMAVGLNMVYGLLRIIHVAHAALYTLGAYVGLYCLYHLSQSLWLSLTLGAVFPALMGALMYRIIYSPVLSAPRYVALIAGAGVFIASQEFYRLIAGPYPYPFNAQFKFLSISSSHLNVTETQMLIITFMVCAFLCLYLIINNTNLGLMWRACTQDMELAASSGININLIIAINFIIGSALAGSAGVLMALYRNSVFPTMGAMVSYKAFVVVVLGGFGSIPGAAIAGILLALAESLLGMVPFFNLPRDAIAFLVMVLVLMFKPKGLFGR